MSVIRVQPRSGLRSALLVALAFCASGVMAQAADKAKELKLSVAVGPAYAMGKAADRWAKAIDDKSGGAFAVKLSPGAVLTQGDPQREFAALRDGGADLAVGSSLFWSGQVTELGVVGLPWLVPDDKDLIALTTGSIADRLTTAVERAGVVPLALAPLGHRELATRADGPRTPAEF